MTTVTVRCDPDRDEPHGFTSQEGGDWFEKGGLLGCVTKGSISERPIVLPRSRECEGYLQSTCRVPPHRPGERLCAKCSGVSSKRRVYLHFMFKEGWYCQFLEDDLKTTTSPA